MSCSLHICKKYEVEYSDKTPLHGYGGIEPFINWLREQDDFDGWIDEGAEGGYTMELDPEFLEAHQNNTEYGKVIRTILDEYDKRNGVARIEVW